MEKKTPHCKLTVVQSMIKAGKVRATVSATMTAAAVGVLGTEAMCKLILSLTTRNFYKSMTTHADHTVWQDVYHGEVNGTRLYVKLTVVDDVLIVSFKEL
ncbi:type II toxin-antitoxin system MqsR family toxin [Massilia suwonensis]|uniref:Type II toxin-antitoxin system MqsR family toxin n=1 Tax=Massilia suwonensis TaxID=648895 RepID=A0ABW0MUQ1_9BURK